MLHTLQRSRAFVPAESVMRQHFGASREHLQAWRRRARRSQHHPPPCDTPAHLFEEITQLLAALLDPEGIAENVESPLRGAGVPHLTFVCPTQSAILPAICRICLLARGV